MSSLPGPADPGKPQQDHIVFSIFGLQLNATEHSFFSGVLVADMILLKLHIF